MQKHDMFYGASAYTFKRAKELRSNMTEAEQMLWERLKKKQLKGYKFRRQHPISKFIADFYCHSAKLVIEVDGSYHNLKGTKFSDSIRTQKINEFGIKVLRFYNAEVINNTEKVIKKIKSYLENK